MRIRRCVAHDDGVEQDLEEHRVDAGDRGGDADGLMVSFPSPTVTLTVEKWTSIDQLPETKSHKKKKELLPPPRRGTGESAGRMKRRAVGGAGEGRCPEFLIFDFKM